MWRWTSKPQAAAGAGVLRTTLNARRVVRIALIVGQLDNVTHSLFALTLARTGTARAVPGATAALLFASNVPDLDIVTAFTGGAEAYLAAHRGATHGVLGLGGLALGVAGIVWTWISRWRDRTRHGADLFTRLLLVSLVGVFMHILMDLPTVYRTRLLSPFSDRWVSFDWLPIIDLHLWTALTAGLILTVRTPAATPRIVLCVVLVMGANYLVRAAAHDRALTLAGHPAPIFRPSSWPNTPRDKLRPCHGVPPPLEGRSCGALAVPTFLSPFQWRIIHAFDDAYELSDLNLLNPSATSPRARYSVDRGPWALRAARGPTAQTFLSFARAPSARVVEETPGGATVTFRDLRFVRGRLEVDDDPGTGLFTLWSRLNVNGAVVAEELRD